jgi:hypothetical protein
MFAQLINPGRRAFGGISNRVAAAAIVDAYADDLREMLTGFTAYFGTFEVDAHSPTVVHHLQSALIPSWVETDQRRKVRVQIRQVFRLVWSAGEE